MKDMEYVVILTQGYDKMEFSFNDEAAAATFARTAAFNQKTSYGYDDTEKEFHVSIELIAGEGVDSKDDF